MIEAILATIAIAAAWFLGTRKGRNLERADHDRDTENNRIATEGRIKGAIRDADSNHSWRDNLRGRK